ncbi:hypothetical protein ACTHAM_001442 [Cellulomonas soli]|uniref:hypothetical protein n=1 Tax=Cellulomonas soli TaxID=931535 RepID=UPI003F85D17F
MSSPTEIRTSVIRVQGHRITVRRTTLRPDDDPPGLRATAPVDPTDVAAAASAAPPSSRTTAHQEP